MREDTDTHARLIRCFLGVFPELPDGEIQTVSLSTIASWDSVATITVLTVIEESLASSFEPEELEHLASFNSIMVHLWSQKGVA